MNGCRQHDLSRLDIPVREQPGIYEPVTIGTDSWIGERAIVAASVGRHCVIGAGSLVLEPVPDYAVAVGCPAKVIRDRRDIARTALPTNSSQDAESTAMAESAAKAGAEVTEFPLPVV